MLANKRFNELDKNLDSIDRLVTLAIKLDNKDIDIYNIDRKFYVDLAIKIMKSRDIKEYPRMERDCDLIVRRAILKLEIQSI